MWFAPLVFKRATERCKGGRKSQRKRHAEREREIEIEREREKLIALQYSRLPPSKWNQCWCVLADNASAGWVDNYYPWTLTMSWDYPAWDHVTRTSGNYQWRKSHLTFGDELGYSITDGCVFSLCKHFIIGSFITLNNCATIVHLFNVPSVSHWTADVYENWIGPIERCTLESAPINLFDWNSKKMEILM